MPDVYRTIPYPDRAYEADERAQTEIADFAKRKDRNLKLAFGGMAATFASSCALGFAHFGAATLFSLVAFVFLFVVGVILLCIEPSGRICGKCGGQLETVWPETSGGIAAEYRICRRCRLFRYMFRTSRR
jgi:hypothetical protein